MPPKKVVKVTKHVKDIEAQNENFNEPKCHSFHFCQARDAYIKSRNVTHLLEYITQLQDIPYPPNASKNKENLYYTMLQRRISVYIAESITLCTMHSDWSSIQQFLDSDIVEPFEYMGIVATYIPEKFQTLLDRCESCKAHFDENIEYWKSEASTQGWDAILSIIKNREKVSLQLNQNIKSLKKLKLSKAQLKQIMDEIMNESDSSDSND